MADSLQIKLSMDEGLKNTWEYLNNRYGALDKASIIRLALNELSEKTKKEQSLDLLSILDEMDAISDEGMTEEEAFEWWNNNKKDL